MIQVVTMEDARQLAYLRTACEEPGSGSVRYSAAMYFYWRGMISDETLEVYRVCSGIDRENPIDTLAALGLASEVCHAKTGITQREARLQ